MPVNNVANNRSHHSPNGYNISAFDPLRSFATFQQQQHQQHQQQQNHHHQNGAQHVNGNGFGGFGLPQPDVPMGNDSEKAVTARSFPGLAGMPPMYPMANVAANMALAAAASAAVSKMPNQLSPASMKAMNGGNTGDAFGNFFGTPTSFYNPSSLLSSLSAAHQNPNHYGTNHYGNGSLVTTTSGTSITSSPYTNTNSSLVGGNTNAFPDFRANPFAAAYFNMMKPDERSLSMAKLSPSQLV